MVKLALLIGVSEYDTGFTPLSSTINDIAAIQQVLQNQEIGGFDDIRLLPNPNRQLMEEAIESLFSDLSKDDLGFLYFSGHGVKDERGKLYLATCITRKSARGELVKSTAVAASFVHDVMAHSRCRRQVLVIDSCFSGAFAEGMLARDNGYADIKNQLGGEGRVVLTSSTSTQYSFEEKGSELSIYTRYFVEGIETGSADKDQDGWIATDELHEYVCSRVQEIEPAMKPEIYSVREGFKIRIARALNGPFKEAHQDWGDAPDVPVFFGRNEELTTLERWITQDRCRLVAIVGIGGIGKTNLSLKLGKGGIGKTDLSLELARGIHEEFEYVIWRSLLNAPPITEVLVDLTRFLSNQQEVDFSKSVSQQISRLLNYLRQKRCLIILDNVESILHGGDYSESHHDDYKGYGELFKKVGEIEHHSCLLLTSREKPREIARLEGRTQPVRSLELTGLDELNGRKIFEEAGFFSGSDDDWQKLIQLYNGNPLALELAARHINDVFTGDIYRFLQHGKPIFGDLRELLDWHIKRLSDLEQEVLYWLAINREPVSILELQKDVVSPEAKEILAETLQLLQQRLPLEKSLVGFTLQPVLIEYMTERLVKQVCKEIETTELAFFNRYALSQATAKDYIRDTQTRLFIKPIINGIINLLGNQQNLVNQLVHILTLARKNTSRKAGYTGGNVINLLRYLKIDLTGYDFSKLTIWQAYLQDVYLCEADFSNSDFKRSMFAEPFGCILSVTFSPNGQLIATGDASKTVRLWRAADSQQLAVFRGHEEWVRVVAFSPDGNILASGGDDSIVNLWNPNTGKCLSTFKEHNNQVKALAFSPNGNILACGNTDGCITLWNVSKNSYLKALYGHTDQLRSITFSPDGHKLATGSADCSIRLWDIDTNQCLKVLEGHQDWVWSVVYSADGKVIISGGGDETIKIWDAQTGDCIKTLQAHSGEVRSVACHPNNQLFASGGDDKLVKIWNLETGECLKTLQGHVSFLWSIAFAPEGRTLVSSSDDRTLKVWDTQTSQCLKTFQGYISVAFSVAQDFIGHTIATGNDDKTVKLWNRETGRIERTLKGHSGWVWAVTFSPDGKLIASGSADHSVKIWDVQTGICLKTFEEHSNWIWTVAFSPDGKLLASGSDDKTVKIWNVDTHECYKTLKGHSYGIGVLAFSPDGAVLATGGRDENLILWDIQTGQRLGTLNSDSVYTLAFCPNSQILATSGFGQGNSERTVKLWNIKTRECIKVIDLEEPANRIGSISFSPDGQVLATGGPARIIKLWDWQKGQCMRELIGHSYAIRSVIFSADNETLVTGGSGEMIKIWNFHSGECLKTLKPPRPYEEMNISGIMGLTDAEKDNLKTLGAVEY